MSSDVLASRGYVLGPPRRDEVGTIADGHDPHGQAVSVRSLADDVAVRAQDGLAVVERLRLAPTRGTLRVREVLPDASGPRVHFVTDPLPHINRRLETILKRRGPYDYLEAARIMRSLGEVGRSLREVGITWTFLHPSDLDVKDVEVTIVDVVGVVARETVLDRIAESPRGHWLLSGRGDEARAMCCLGLLGLSLVAEPTWIAQLVDRLRQEGSGDRLEAELELAVPHVPETFRRWLTDCLMLRFVTSSDALERIPAVPPPNRAAGRSGHHDALLTALASAAGELRARIAQISQPRPKPGPDVDVGDRLERALAISELSGIVEAVQNRNRTDTRALSVALGAPGSVILLVLLVTQTWVMFTLWLLALATSLFLTYVCARTTRRDGRNVSVLLKHPDNVRAVSVVGRKVEFAADQIVYSMRLPKRHIESFHRALKAAFPKVLR